MIKGGENVPRESDEALLLRLPAELSGGLLVNCKIVQLCCGPRSNGVSVDDMAMGR